MGRRSRKRSAAAGTAAPPPPARQAAPARPPGPRPRRARLDEAPKAPWSPFPLVELTILIGIVIIVAAFFSGGDRRPILLACGFALVTLAGLELSVREHFSGYRSHSSLLSGVCAVLAVIPLYFLTGLPQVVLLLVGAVVFALAFQLLRTAFARRSGGLWFRA
jgi:hypothetical protein